METKICKICEEEKELTGFRKGRNQCKKCLTDKFKNFHKEYYITNIESLKQNMKDNYLENIDIRKKQNKEYRDNNKEKSTIYNKNWRKSNKERISKYKSDNKERIRETNKIYNTNRMKNDLIYRIKVIIRKRISYIFNHHFIIKNSKTEEIIGCTFEEFKNHIELKLEPWMNWNNYGKYDGSLNFGWDMDHIIPLKEAKTEEEVIELNHYTNFQPLDSYINRVVKKDKLIW